MIKLRRRRGVNFWWLVVLGLVLFGASRWGGQLGHLALELWQGYDHDIQTELRLMAGLLTN